MREIARRAGRGSISASTVHNIFRSSRVPGWDYLVKVIIALGGDHDQQEFLILWQAAWRAENDVETGLRSPVGASGRSCDVLVFPRKALRNC